MKNTYKTHYFEGLTIDKEDRSAIIRYHAKGNCLNYMQPISKDIKVIFHEGGEMDFENFEFLTDEEFNDLTTFITEDEALNETFPCEV
jgi:hypothetical protein